MAVRRDLNLNKALLSEFYEVFLADFALFLFPSLLNFNV